MGAHGAHGGRRMRVVTAIECGVCVCVCVYVCVYVCACACVVRER